MSFKTQVVADYTGEWVGNGLRFATKEEAEGYGANLAGRWVLVRDIRTIEVDEPVSHVWNRKTSELTSLVSGYTRVPPHRVSL
jgi:hypothetical protein